MRYMVLDLETENHMKYKRFANPFIQENYIVARGWKYSTDTSCSYQYFCSRDDVTPLTVPDDVSLIIGHNIKFDLLYEWESPGLQEFFRRGGKIWCTQYAEYLLNAQKPEFFMNSMDQIIEKYGGRLKINEVKALWEAGYLTSQIDRDLLIDYLVGTEQEHRNSGDIGNTELIFLGQLSKARELGMLTSIMSRFDGLLCTTEMEYNGLFIDLKEAAAAATELTQRSVQIKAELDEYLPELPDGLEFNWNSGAHVSCLIYGGTLRYKKQAPYLDPKTGELARYTVKQQWPLFNGQVVSPEKAGTCGSQDVFTSGKRKGEYKFKTVQVPGELKVKYQDFFFKLPRMVKPSPKWKLETTDGAGECIYKTDAETIDSLKDSGVPFLALLAERNALAKDLGTYYIARDSSGNLTGMLTSVMPDSNVIHHSINHTSTVTSRLSSSDPNLQNIPREDKSQVKKMFCSRFGSAGAMLELDYKQLEVVVQAMLSGDPQLCADVSDGIDFHCKRVAYKHGISYEEAVLRCKDESYPDHMYWKHERTGAKVFSFQRAYGAGVKLIAESTGMPLQDVQKLADAEDALYPGIAEFNSKVQAECAATAVPFRDPVRGNKVYRTGHYTCFTGTRYSFRSYDAPKFLQDRGIPDSFKPTEQKNYPVQGTGGEVVQLVLGKLFRRFNATNNYNNSAFLVNTVHDCIWVDTRLDTLDRVARECRDIMQSIPKYIHELYDVHITVPFPVDAEVGSNLYTKHHYNIGEN